MDFRRFNEWKTDQLLMALKENNTKELEYLRKKKDSFLLSYLFNADFGKKIGRASCRERVSVLV